MCDAVICKPAGYCAVTIPNTVPNQRFQRARIVKCCLIVPSDKKGQITWKPTARLNNAIVKCTKMGCQFGIISIIVLYPLIEEMFGDVCKEKTHAPDPY